MTPLVVAVGQALINLSDGSALLAPSIEYNITENIYLATGAYVGRGKAPRIKMESGPEQIPLEIGSEFGLYSDVYFISFRFYF